MSKEMGVILLGVAVVIVPYLGVPSAWRTLLLVIAGIALIILGFLLRAQGRGARSDKHSPYHPFVESDSAPAAHPSPIASDLHDSQKEGITSLN